MKIPKIIQYLFFILIITNTVSCRRKNATDEAWYKNAIEVSALQLTSAAQAYVDSMKNPRTFENGKVLLVSEKDWTSGFFPGCLWLMYQLNGDEQLKLKAEKFTSFVEKACYRTNTHDLGFILYNSYGKAYQITGNENYAKVLEKGANSLMTRYRSKIGLIKSWEKIVGPWEFPVIIDNMLNLEFLYETGKRIGNPKMMEAAVSHADKTLANHFRDDFSSVHVVEYDSVTGQIKSRETHQGYNHESSWARGQAWGLYGFTMMYRLSRKAEYLNQAQKIASFILNHPHLPSDLVPYWDFDAPNIPNEPRDASAAAVIASALLELSAFVKNGEEYFSKAEIILKTLSSDDYLAKPGTNGFFILKHSTGNWPKKSEIDVPIIYADYYYLEALKRFTDLVKKIH